MVLTHDPPHSTPQVAAQDKTARDRQQVENEAQQNAALLKLVNDSAKAERALLVDTVRCCAKRLHQQGALGLPVTSTLCRFFTQVRIAVDDRSARDASQRCGRTQSSN